MADEPSAIAEEPSVLTEEPYGGFLGALPDPEEEVAEEPSAIPVDASADAEGLGVGASDLAEAGDPDQEAAAAEEEAPGGAADEEEEEEEPEPPAPPLGPLVKDREAALAAVRANGFGLQAMPPELRGDKEVTLAAVSQNGLALECATPEMRGDLEVAKVALAQTANALRHAEAALTSDKAAMMELVTQDGDALQFASPLLQDDRELVLAAVSKKGWTLRWASAELREDRAYMMEVVKANPRALRYASDEVRADKNVVLAAVSKYGMALEVASAALRNDDEVVLSAVRKHGMALQYASMQLRDDRRLVMEALLQNKYSWKYASRRLHQDPETMAAQGLGGSEAAVLMDKNAKQASAKVMQTEDGFVEIRKPWRVQWPVVIVAPYGGELAPDTLPDRATGCNDPCWRTLDLAEEIWEAFVVGSPGPPALVRMKLARSKVDADVPRHLAAENCEAALAAYDCYHAWLEESLRACVQKFGFALLIDVRGQSHRRGVTELGYLLTAEDLLLYNDVLDIAPPHATSLDAVLRGQAPPKGRPGGLSALVRGPTSLGGLLEKEGVKCIPCPRMPEPVDAFRLAQSQAEHRDPDLPQEKEIEGETVYTYVCGGYATRRYAAADTLTAGEYPLPAADQDSWARSVAAVHIEACWDARKEREARQRFGHVTMGAIQTLLRVWRGWTV